MFIRKFLKFISNTIFVILSFLAFLGTVNLVQILYFGFEKEAKIGLIPKSVCWILLFLFFLIFGVISKIKSIKKSAT